MTNNLCGERCYPNITEAKIKSIMDALKSAGATITGNNPWDADFHKHGVVIRAKWDSSKSNLCITVLSKNWYVSCDQIWKEIDKYLPHISGLADKDVM